MLGPLAWPMGLLFFPYGIRLLCLSTRLPFYGPFANSQPQNRHLYTHTLAFNLIEMFDFLWATRLRHIFEQGYFCLANNMLVVQWLIRFWWPYFDLWANILKCRLSSWITGHTGKFVTSLFSLVYFVQTHHVGHVLLSFLLCWWISINKTLSRLLCNGCVWNVILGGWMWVCEMKWKTLGNVFFVCSTCWMAFLLYNLCTTFELFLNFCFQTKLAPFFGSMAPQSRLFTCRINRPADEEEEEEEDEKWTFDLAWIEDAIFFGRMPSSRNRSSSPITNLFNIPFNQSIDWST